MISKANPSFHYVDAFVGYGLTEKVQFINIIYKYKFINIKKVYIWFVFIIETNNYMWIIIGAKWTQH